MGGEFDLRAEAASERAGDLVIRLLCAGMAVLGASGSLLILAEVILHGSQFGVAQLTVIVGGVVILVTTVAFLRFLTGRSLSRVVIDDRGVELTRTDGRSKLIRWTDPQFGFDLLDYTTQRPPVERVTPIVHPYRAFFLGGWASSSDFPKEAVDVWFALAGANGVRVERSRRENGPLEGVTEYVGSAGRA
jgi:hypothetical protein